MLILWICLIIMLMIAMSFFIDKSLQKIAIIIVIFLPAMALSLYWYWGHSQQWLNYQSAQNSVSTLPNTANIIEQLQQHLAQQPDSAEGWYLLGRLYANQQQFSAAASAFAKANQLQPHQINTLVNYAEVLFMEDNQKNIMQIQALLKEALVLDQQNSEALNLLAITYYQQRQYSQAIQIWEKLTEQYPPDTADGQSLLKAIAEAQKRMAKKV